MLICLSMLGCDTHDPEVRMGAQIADTLRADMEHRTDHVLDLVRAHEDRALDELFSSGQVGGRREKSDEWRAVRSAIDDVNLSHSLSIEIKWFQPVRQRLLAPLGPTRRLVLDALGPGGHVFVLLLHGTREDTELIVGVIWREAAKQWLPLGLHVGTESINGKRATDWYERARRYAERNLDLPAALDLKMAGRCLRPLPFIEYVDEKEIIDLSNVVASRLRARLPMPGEVDLGASTVYLVSIEPLMTLEDGLVPHVKYVSRWGWPEPRRLQSEAARLSAHLHRVLPGYCGVGPKVVLTAFGEVPVDPRRSYRSYGVVVDCPSGVSWQGE